MLKMINMLKNFDPSTLEEGECLVYMVENEGGEIVERINTTSNASEPSSPSAQEQVEEQTEEPIWATRPFVVPSVESRDVARPSTPTRKRGKLGNQNAGAPSWSDEELRLARMLSAQGEFTGEEIGQMLADRGFPKRSSRAVASKLRRG